MLCVTARDDESPESMLRRIKRVLDNAKIPKEVRKRQFHVKRSTLKQRRKAAAMKRWAKKLSRDQQQFKDSYRGRGSR